jgi:hypothetical protein
VFRRDGQLNVIAGLVRRDFENQLRGSGYLIPFEPGSRAKAVDPDVRIAVESGAGNSRRADWVVLWLEPKSAPATAGVPAAPSPAVAQPAGSTSGAGAGTAPAVAAPQPGTPVQPVVRPGTAPAAPAQPDAESLYRNVSERLKALQKLRDSGLITVPEYQEKRRQILKDL